MNHPPLARLLGLCVLGLGLVLTGCAQFYALRGDVGQQVDAWVAQKEYGRAIDTLEDVSPHRADYHALRAKLRVVRHEADAYVRSVVKRAGRLEDTHHWADAGRLLSTARDRLPDDTRLHKAWQAFSTRRAAYVQQLEWRALIQRGQWLVSDMPLRKQIVAADPDSWSASRHLRTSQEEGDETGGELAKAAHQAMQTGKLDLAEQALVLAEQLNPGPRVKAALAEVRRRQASERAVAARHRRARVASLVDEQVAVYRRCSARRDWPCARRALTEIQRIDPHNPTLAKLRRQFDARVHKQFVAGMEHGRRLYSQGKIKAALDTWVALRRLDPNNTELEAHITRAQRVLEKLKELREHPATVVPP